MEDSNNISGAGDSFKKVTPVKPPVIVVVHPVEPPAPVKINIQTYQDLKALVKSKGFLFFEKDDYNLNFVWQRTSDIITNYFTDFLHVAYGINGVEQLLTIPATTKAGIKGAIDSPITYDGVTGTAIIIPDQYIGAWEFHDSYTEFSTYPYFRQIKPIKYWRDGNKDLVIDEVQEQDGKIFGTHWHRMSNIGYTGYPINNWSLGCMGAEEPNWKKLLPATRESVKRFAIPSVPHTAFTGTIIETYK